MNMTIARIVLYILAGALLNVGWINEELANFLRMDADVQMFVGAGVAALTLLWWRIAKRMGWAT